MKITIEPGENGWTAEVDRGGIDPAHWTVVGERLDLVLEQVRLLAELPVPRAPQQIEVAETDAEASGPVDSEAAPGVVVPSTGAGAAPEPAPMVAPDSTEPA